MAKYTQTKGYIENRCSSNVCNINKDHLKNKVPKLFEVPSYVGLRVNYPLLLSDFNES